MYKFNNFYISIYRKVGRVYITAKAKGQWRKTVVDLEQWDKIKDVPGVAINGFYNNQRTDQAGVRFKIYAYGRVTELSRFLNDTPEHLVCDHMNHKPWDNTTNNLRNITSLQNLKYKKKTVQRRNLLKQNFLPVLSEVDGLMYCKKTKLNKRFLRGYNALKQHVNDL